MDDEKWEHIFAGMKVLVEKQEAVRETMKDLALSLEVKRLKERGESLTIDGWRKRKAEVLFKIGLGPKPNVWGY